MKERILIVDDDPEQCELLGCLVDQLDYATTATTSPEKALEHAGRDSLDAIVTDLGMSTMSGLELCSRILMVRPDVPVVVVTGMGTMESAIAAMRAGAYDFLNKPVDIHALGLALRRAVQHRRLAQEIKQLRAATPIAPSDCMIGESEAIKRVKDLIARVASSDTSVLIQGETGTGKELVARAVHRSSSRSAGPFVAINCAAVPANLLESELFGHARGAFTDARASREGLFVQASGGTLLLDEIGEMPLTMQTKLLRALQERSVRPVGSDREVPFDTRIVAATHRDLESDIAERRFREDLYYRINVVKITVPPLRDRGNDVLLLATRFLRKASERSRGEEIGLSPRLAAVLLGYDWPGNVRELENCIERTVALARYSQISAEDLPERIRTFQRKASLSLAASTAGREEEILSLDELERHHILRTLKSVDGNQARAAALLGVDRRTLYRRIDKYAIALAPRQSPPQESLDQ
jgi:two-component system, NtrC family, response regulator HydG